MLYEPTNIIPSTITQTGTIASANNIDIEWQINGNSAMSAFQIDVYEDTPESAFVHSTGIISQYPSASANILPFWGKDRLGNYVIFKYAPSDITWGTWGLTDGNSYKFVITQFYAANVVIYFSGTATIIPYNTAKILYFSYSKNGKTYYPTFNIVNTLNNSYSFMVYYCDTTGIAWATWGVPDSGQYDNNLYPNITFTLNTVAPQAEEDGEIEVVDLGAGQQLAETGTGSEFYNLQFQAANAPSAILLRTAPELTISQITSPISSATLEFTANYSQAQGDNIYSVRWQLYDNNSSTTPIADTGAIYTPVLEYEYNGLFNDQNYTIVCTVVTQNNVEVQAQETFTVQYNEATYTGDFAATCLCDEDAALLSWDRLTVIPATVDPAGEAEIINNRLILPDSVTITWDTQTDIDGQQQALSIQSPWTIATRLQVNYAETTQVEFSGNIYKSSAGDLSECVSGILYSFDGEYAILFGAFDGGASIFKVAGTEFTYLADLNAGSALSGNFYVGTMNSSRSTVFLYSLASGLMMFDWNGDVVTYESTLSPSVGEISAMACSPIANILVVGTDSRLGDSASAQLVQYRFINGEFIHIANLYTESRGTAVPAVYSVSFNWNGTYMLAVVGSNSNTSTKVLLYSIAANGAMTLVNTITDSRLNGTLCAKFAPFSNYVIFGGEFSGALSLWNLSENSLQFVENITLNDGTSINSPIRDIAFSDIGDAFIAVGGEGAPQYNGVAYCFNFNAGTASYANDIALPTGSYSSYVDCCAISPNGGECVLGGYFTPYACAFEIIRDENIYQIFSLQGNNLRLSKNGNMFQLYSADELLAQASPFGAGITSYNGDAVIALTPSQMQITLFIDGESRTTEVSVTYSQQPISELQLRGEQVCDYVAIVDGDGANFVSKLSDENFSPDWGAQDYTLELYAPFIDGYDGGIGTTIGDGFRIYRRTANGSENKEIATLPSITTSIKDFGIKSGQSYLYDFYAYDATGAFMGVVSTTVPVRKQFKRYSLLATQYNATDGCYHVKKEYQFSCGLKDEALLNNNNKSYAQNFTPYPTVFNSTANYASGTLQAYIGFVDKKTYRYWDDTVLMKELNGLSTTTDTLFLRDLKGHLWLVSVGAITQTVKYGTREMQVTISLPWTEIGNADNVSIIQTPDDAAWNSAAAQVLDVKLDVDSDTGKLFVTYPYPYNSTAFYLIGVTPQGQTSLVNELPDTLAAPSDGILKAKSND